MKSCKRIYLTVALAMVLGFTGCSAGKKGNAGEIGNVGKESNVAEQKDIPRSISFTDDLGCPIRIQPPKKVAAVSSSYAKLWLLAGGKLAAVTEDAIKEGVVTEKEIIDLGSVKTPSLESLAQAEPELVILSAQIEKNVQLKNSLEAMGIQPVYFRIEHFEDYLRALKICTDLTGEKALYEQNGLSVEKEIKQQLARAEGKEKKSVLFLRAFSGGIKAKDSSSMTGGMLKDLGCRNIADENHLLTENLSLEYVLMADPEYIFVTTMGENEKQAEKEMEQLTGHPAWESLRAVEEKHVIWLPKSLFHDKPNEKWAESYKLLADYLYGEEEDES